MLFHGRLDNYLGIGVNNLIKDGAILTTKIEDILINYPQFKKKKCIKKLINSSKLCKNIRLNKIESNKKINIDKTVISSEYIQIYNLIKSGYSFLDEIFSQIVYEKDESITVIIDKLVNMELEGLIKKDISGGYNIVE